MCLKKKRKKKKGRKTRFHLILTIFPLPLPRTQSKCTKSYNNAISQIAARDIATSLHAYIESALTIRVIIALANSLWFRLQDQMREDLTSKETKQAGR